MSWHKTPASSATSGSKLPLLKIARTAYLQLGAAALGAMLLARGDGPLQAAIQAGVICVVALATFAVHEGGHVLAARAYRLQVHAVVVRGLLAGGTVRTLSPNEGVNAVVSIAGPVASGVLGLMGFGIAIVTPDVYRAGRALLVANMFVVLSTLTAGHRSDGVRAWRAWRAWRAQRAGIIAPTVTR